GLLRGPVRRHRLWPRRRGHPGPGLRQDAGEPGRFRLGRHGLDGILGRSGARPLGGLPDAADAVLVLSAPQGAARARLLVPRRALRSAQAARRLVARAATWYGKAGRAVMGGRWQIVSVTWSVRGVSMWRE